MNIMTPKLKTVSNSPFSAGIFLLVPTIQCIPVPTFCMLLAHMLVHVHNTNATGNYFQGLATSSFFSTETNP